jgi:hypothetical protein
MLLTRYLACNQLMLKSAQSVDPQISTLFRTVMHQQYQSMASIKVIKEKDFAAPK